MAQPYGQIESMKIIVQVVRIAVGILFIISGLIKVNDPLGLAYKMDEYFAVWHWAWASPFSLYLSIGMNLFEIAAGVALLLGIAPRLVTQLLLVLIVFFTFLTGYAVLSGNIKTCGCFGDCLPIAPWQSFTKDLVLLAFILLLTRYTAEIKKWLPTRAAMFVLLLAAGFAFWGQLYALKHLPFVDCLAYKKGNNLLEKMQPPAGSVPDSIAVVYTYLHQGKEISFDAMNFPADFNDSTYEYKSRAEQIVRKGNAEPAIKDLAWYSASGADTTKALLNQTGPYLLFFVKDFDAAATPWQSMWDKIYLQANKRNIPLMVVSNQPVAAQRWFNMHHHYAIPVLTCDGTVMKTMLRSKVGLVAMNGAVVAGKWSEPDMNLVMPWLQKQ
jgi:uncharacterized membrane protein YphA (DoxX/SURF4 family)